MRTSRWPVVAGLAVLAACTPPKDTVPKSYAAACRADTASIRSAEETFRAATAEGNYATAEQLVPGFMSSPPSLHAITDVAAGAYKIRVADSRCGVTASTNDANVVDAAHPRNR